MGAVPALRGLMHASDGDAPRAFYSGTQHHPIYVQHVAPPRDVVSTKTPVVMVHGGFHAGNCYLITPDARPGWAPLFAAAGRSVFVPDWPGHGRSPRAPDFVTLSTAEVMRSLIVLLEQVGPAVLLVHSAGGPIAWRIAEMRPELIAAIVGIAPGPPANLLPDLPDDPTAILRVRPRRQRDRARKALG